MTYGELSNIKTRGFNLNHIIADIVGNARWGYQMNEWKDVPVSEYDLKTINTWAEKEGVEFPLSVAA